MCFSLKKEIKACEERISSLRSRIGAEHTRIENSKNILSETLKNSNISSKTNLDNLKKVNTFVNTTSVTHTNFATSKENCSLNENDRGGFVTASTYLNTIVNPMPLQNTISYQKAVIDAFPAGKASALTVSMQYAQMFYCTLLKLLITVIKISNKTIKNSYHSCLNVNISFDIFMLITLNFLVQNIPKKKFVAKTKSGITQRR